jgi:hypothetical protein
VCILCYILLLIARPADSYFLLLKAIDPCAGSSCTSFADSSSAPTPQVLAMRRTKDPVPIPAMAETIGKLAVRLHGLGKLLHLLLTGCNTVNLVLPICKHIDGMCAAAKQSVWVLATHSVVARRPVHFPLVSIWVNGQPGTARVQVCNAHHP